MVQSKQQPLPIIEVFDMTQLGYGPIPYSRRTPTRPQRLIVVKCKQINNEHIKVHQIQITPVFSYTV